MDCYTRFLGPLSSELHPRIPSKNTAFTLAIPLMYSPHWASFHSAADSLHCSRHASYYATEVTAQVGRTRWS
jgi:hypothetical protein